MVWKVELSSLAQKQLAKLDIQVTKRILLFLYERITQLDNPRSIGDALKGSRLGTFWKYRVGDYRIIASIEDHKLNVLIVQIGNRKEIYRE